MKLLTSKKIGMRNIKTAVAVALCLLFNLLFNFISMKVTASNAFIDILNLIFVRETPVYACVASVIIMQSTVQDSVVKGISRVIGTLVGGVFGTVLLYTSLLIPSEFFKIALVAIGITLCIHICNIINHSDSAAISCVVLIIIMVTIGSNEPLFYAIDRVIDTTGGIIMAVLVNNFLPTPKSMKPQPTNEDPDLQK